MDRQDLWLGIGVAGFGLLLFFVIIPTGVAVPQNVPARVLSPAFWPKVIAGLLVGLGILMALQGWLARAAADPPEGVGAEDHANEEEEGIWWSPALRIGITAALLLLYYWLVEFLGMVLASSLALLAFGFFGNTRYPIALVITAIVLPLMMYGFFFYVAGVPIPTGSLVSFP